MLAPLFFRESYKYILKPIFFRCDPEWIHDIMTDVGTFLGNHESLRAATRFFFSYEHPMLEQDILGMHFKNPIGLTAGFDKNALMIPIIESVGFGFSEVGSITGEPCAGNPKPRLWRLPKSQALMVWYGLKNDGCDVIAKRIRNQKLTYPIGTSVARTNDASSVEIDAGIADYAKAFRAMADLGAYTTVNISCPNTCGGEPFTTPERLEKLLAALDEIPTQKPIFLKFPIDLSFDAVDALIHVAEHHRVQGLILSNLTKVFHAPTIDQTELTSDMKGGIGGIPTQAISNALIQHVFKQFGQRFILIGSGGVFSAQDAYEKIRAGASLVQLATGMIFQGPQLIGEINHGLVELLKKDGFTSISEAIGVDVIRA